ncbi:hypothetical protein TWF694_009423 [Orbilia ellipsospora]|uniref:Uncharacterized protein n=1 Tax=Orbilia ellipsospora TaxID=2528407 RepID=A0AAV9XBM5_9PEZI
MSSNANAYLNRDGTLFATPTAGADATAWSYTYDSAGVPVTMEAGKATASASVGSYTGVNAGVEAFKYGHKDGEFKLGLALDTGAGVQNKSVQVKVLGCGLSLGNETGISFFGSEIKAKNVFGWFGF